MRKLLNTLYITQEDYYLSRERDNIVIKQEGKVIKRYPYRIIENIICFSYLGASPSLVRLCNENNISLSFLTPNGRFCGRFIGLTNGNVLLRREQYRIADDDGRSIEYARRNLLAKISNSRKYVLRFRRDHIEKINVELFNEVDMELLRSIELVTQVQDKDSLRGIEGNAATTYFRVFNELSLVNQEVFQFKGRSKRPPLDCINAMLSFGYSLLTNECQAALETVGIDSYVGFFHTDRPGRASMALDLVEEFRSFIVDRFVFSLINKRQIAAKHFDFKENGSVLLNDKGRSVFIKNWQVRKHTEIMHPFINEKVKLMLLPYVQAQLMAKTIREDLPSYPPFLV